MTKPSDREKLEYMDGLLAQLVQGIEAIQEELAGAAIYGKDVSAEHVRGQLDNLLVVEAPDGKPGTLAADEGGFFLMGSTTMATDEIIV